MFQGRNVGYSYVLDEDSRNIFESIENTHKPILLVRNQRATDLRLHCAYFLEMKSASGNIIADTTYYSNKSAEEYTLYVYAANDKIVNVDMKIKGSAGQTVNVDGSDIVLEKGKNDISKNIAVNSGITKIHLKSNEPFGVSACDVK